MKNFGTARERYTGPAKVPLPQRRPQTLGNRSPGWTVGFARDDRELLAFCSASVSIQTTDERASDWGYWRQWSLPPGWFCRIDRTRDRDTVRRAFRFHRWWNNVRPQRLFFAATRTRAPHPSARTESSRQHLRAAVSQRPLDYLRDGCGQFAGKIRSTGRSAAFAVL